MEYFLIFAPDYKAGKLIEIEDQKNLHHPSWPNGFQLTGHCSGKWG